MKKENRNSIFIYRALKNNVAGCGERKRGNEGNWKITFFTNQIKTSFGSEKIERLCKKKKSSCQIIFGAFKVHKEDDRDTKKVNDFLSNLCIFLCVCASFI